MFAGISFQAAWLVGCTALLVGFAAGFGLFAASLRKRISKPPAAETRHAVRAELWRLLRLPPTLRSAGDYELWRIRLRNEGLPLAIMLERHVVVALAEALDDLRDIFRTTEPGDELLREIALTLLPVYEASAGFPPLQEIDPREFQSSRLAGWEPRVGRPNGDSLADMKFLTETPGLRNYSTRLQPHLMENRDVPGTRPIGEGSNPPPSRLRAHRRTTAAPEVEPAVPMATFSAPNGNRLPPTAIPQGKLSRTLESILKSSRPESDTLHAVQADGSHFDKAEAVGFGHPLRLAGDFERPSSRLKREPPRDKSEESARKAANAVGRTREWLGRLEVSIEEVRDGCDGFGIEFEEEFIRLELGKPLPPI